MNFMNVALEEAKIAYDNGEVPVGAVIVINNEIVARNHNTREIDNNVLSHAEIKCILDLTNSVKTWKLDNCDMYVTLKPCPMCEAVIKQARIKNVYYLIDKTEDKLEFYRTNVCKIDHNEDENIKYKFLLNNFFKNIRK